MLSKRHENDFAHIVKLMSSFNNDVKVATLSHKGSGYTLNQTTERRLRYGRKIGRRAHPDPHAWAGVSLLFQTRSRLYSELFYKVFSCVTDFFS